MIRRNPAIILALVLSVSTGMTVAPAGGADVGAVEPTPTLVAFFPFTYDLMGWTPAGDGTLTVATGNKVSDVLNTHLQALGDAGFEVRSPPITMTKDHCVSFHFRLGDGIETTPIVDLRTAAGEDVLRLRVRSGSLEYSDQGSDGVLTYDSAGHVDTGWHRVDIVLQGAEYLVGLDQGPMSSAGTFTEEDPTTLVLRPGPRGIDIDNVRVTTAPLTHDHEFTTALPSRGFDVTFEGTGVSGHVRSYDKGILATGVLYLTSGVQPDARAHVSFPAGDVGPVTLITSVVATSTAWPPLHSPDHAAALVGLNAEGDVVWAVTTAPAVNADGVGDGFWFWGTGAAPHALDAAPVLNQHWRQVWVLVDAGEATVEVYVDGRPAGHFEGIAQGSVARIAVGDIWDGLVPTGAAKVFVDQVSAMSVPPGWTPGLQVQEDVFA